jgi:hypothetical protein
MYDIQSYETGILSYLYLKTSTTRYSMCHSVLTEYEDSYLNRKSLAHGLHHSKVVMYYPILDDCTLI